MPGCGCSHLSVCIFAWLPSNLPAGKPTDNRHHRSVDTASPLLSEREFRLDKPITIRYAHHNPSPPSPLHTPRHLQTQYKVLRRWYQYLLLLTGARGRPSEGRTPGEGAVKGAAPLAPQLRRPGGLVGFGSQAPSV
jgi:hypothetical protein